MGKKTIRFSLIVVLCLGLVLLGVIIVFGQSGAYSVDINYLEGQNCLESHGEIYLDIQFSVDEFDENDTVMFSIMLSPQDPRLHLKINSSLESYPVITKLISDKLIVKEVTGENVLLKWFFSPRIPSGTFTVKILLGISVEQLAIHENYEGFYQLLITYDYGTVTSTTTINWNKVIDKYNQILAYILLTMLSLSFISSTKGLDKVISRFLNRQIHRKDIVNFHKIVSELAGVLAIIHVFLSLVSPFWFKILALWPLPTLYVPTDLMNALMFEDFSFGIEVGKWALIILGFTLITGLRYKQIIKKYGKRTASYTQKISYFALVLLLWHVFSIGRLAMSIPLLVPVTGVLILLPLLVIIVVSIIQILKKQKGG